MFTDDHVYALEDDRPLFRAPVPRAEDSSVGVMLYQGAARFKRLQTLGLSGPRVTKSPILGREEVEFVVRNNSDEPVQIYFVQGTTNRRVRELKAQEVFTSKVLLGSQWRAYVGRKNVASFTVSREKKTWDIVTPGRTASVGGRGQCKIMIKNNRKAAIKQFWVDGQGNLKEFGSIPPGGTSGNTTYVGHRWEAHEGGRVVSKYVVPVGGGTWEIR